MKLVQNFMLFLPVALASSLGEEGVHSCAGTITATLASPIVASTFVASAGAVAIYGVLHESFVHFR